METPIYLDYMASTPIDPIVAAAMQECLVSTSKFANPASQHSFGQVAKQAITQASEQVAQLINAKPQEIIWTSGATESVNLALQGVMQFYQRKGRHLITSVAEHKAVLETCHALERAGNTITYLPVNKLGLIDLQQLAQAIRPDTVMVSLLHVNNEIGVIQDVHKIAEIVKSKGVLLHLDAAQSIGKIPVDVNKLAVDLLSFTAHKFYGPKGVGALFVRQQPRVHLVPQIQGGGQQHGLRSGTLATHQIIGMGIACQLAQQLMTSENIRIAKLRDQLWQGINDLPGVYINGDMQSRIVHNLNVCFANIDGESLQYALRNLAVSSGAACTTARIEPSHVLLALGLSQTHAFSSLRFSLGRFTTEQEIETAITLIKQQVLRLISMIPITNNTQKMSNASV